MKRIIALLAVALVWTAACTKADDPLTLGLYASYQDGYNGWAYTGLTILCIPKSGKRFTGRVLENSTGIYIKYSQDKADAANRQVLDYFASDRVI